LFLLRCGGNKEKRAPLKSMSISIAKDETRRESPEKKLGQASEPIFTSNPMEEQKE